MRGVVFHVLAVASLIACSSCQQPRFDPADCQTLPDGSKIESPFLCNQFFVCENGMLSVEGSCPSNMLFDAETKVCDFAENVDCKGVPLPPEFETEIPKDTTPNTETEAPNSTTPSTKCPQEDPEEPIFLPVENDCKSYILCFHGKDIVRSCPSNMYWNSESLECGPSSAHCKVSSDETLCHIFSHIIYSISSKPTNPTIVQQRASILFPIQILVKSSSIVGMDTPGTKVAHF